MQCKGASFSLLMLQHGDFGNSDLTAVASRMPHFNGTFHPEFQEIASVGTDTGDYQEKRLAHPVEAERFYRSLASVAGWGMPP
jgi:hypothetical protein